MLAAIRAAMMGQNRQGEMTSSRSPDFSHWKYLLLLALVPVATMALLMTETGRKTMTWAVGVEDMAWVFPGMTVAAARPPVHGIVVTSVRSDSEAMDKGVTVGDSIVTIDGHDFGSLRQALAYLRHDRRPKMRLAIMHEHHLQRLELSRMEDGGYGG